MSSVQEEKALGLLAEELNVAFVVPSAVLINKLFFTVL